jgi:copper chaperone
MLEFKVEGMTCGHCVSAVKRAVQSIDPAATVEIDRESGRVAVETASDTSAIRQAIEAEGYSVR